MHSKHLILAMRLLKVPCNRPSDEHASAQALPNAAELVSAIYKRTFHFEGPDLARARTHAGDGTRLRRAVTKLLQGAGSHCAF